MSTQNMTLKNNTNDNTFNFQNENNFNSFSQKKSIHLRDQFNFVFAELFKKEENKNNDNISSLKENSQEEKKRELEINIAKEEKRISELEKLKKEKLIKVKN